MKSSLDCIVCLHRQALRTARIVTKDRVKISQVLKATMNYFLSTDDWQKSPLEFAYDLYPLFYNILGVEDPYKDLKYKSNKIAQDLYPWAKKVIEESPNPLLLSLKFAAVGNIADYGAMDEFNLEEQIKTSIDRDFTINDVIVFEKKVNRAENILYFLDNAGEAVFDKIFIETLLSLYPNIVKISVVAKKYPIINDMTEEDAYELGFSEDDRVEILTNWKDVRWSNEISKYDLVISKGQGNYEGLSEYSGIFFLLVAKCDVIAQDLNVSVGDFVFKLS